MKAIVISSQKRQRPKSCIGTIESIVMSVTRRKVGNQIEITEFTRLWSVLFFLEEDMQKKLL
ncbi:hypothetical protein F2Q68_00045731 [Brassica cretica]|uniref:Uncharacterized protein n=1 Tax=Brassica cretica TaxID=69181 RepID=A0A8S9LPF1_BRACR|nr:hypothetical protein F2Q68_00045731 [Brassica cretica]